MLHLQLMLELIARPVLGLSIIGFTFLVGCSSKPSGPPEPVAVEPNPTAVELAKALEQPINLDDPATCAVCHAAVYAEWTESMHARAHHTKDPIYGAMRAFRIGIGQKIEGKCANCHAPRADKDLEGPAALTGVSCATCHNLEAVHSAEASKGRRQLVFAKDDTMRSARDVPDGTSPVHGNGPALPELADGKSLCLACHGTHENPAGVPVCTTGSELEEHAGSETCVSCHMPEVDAPSGVVSSKSKHRSHQFLGPHRSYETEGGHILEEAVQLTGQLRGRRLVVSLRNQSGHSFPSGFPGRMAVLRIRGLDAEGRTVWKNFESDAMTESPESVLNKVYADENGEPTLPPLAKSMLRDSRLRPDETREIIFEVDPATASAELALSYYLVPPPAAKRIGVDAEELLRPVPVARLVLQREP